MAEVGALNVGERKLSRDLNDYFPTDTQILQYSDADCKEISRMLLEELGPPYSTVPRIYIVLRMIGQVSLLPKFTNLGCTDLWFPFDKQSLPRTVSQSHQNLFLEVQSSVITKGLDLENDEKHHVHFVKGEELPFFVKEAINKGGYGTVDRVQSQVSGREYARKTFQRGRTQIKELKSFATELQILKRINHQHCVELISVASYTDPKCFGILMLPVADCDLEQYFCQAVTVDVYGPVLTKAVGCLASALSYLHEEKIRHRDIKPSNILVKGGRVFFTDFGISLDWQDRTRSTTTGNFGLSRPYCAPEVQNYEKRNSKSDVFSLGCVYVEILTILCGRTIRDMRETFKSKSDTIWFSNNIATAKEWIRDLPTTPAQVPVIDWIGRSVALHEDARLTSSELHRTICGPQATHIFCCEDCQIDEDSSSGVDDDLHLWDDTREDTRTEMSSTDSEAVNITSVREGNKALDSMSTEKQKASPILPYRGTQVIAPTPSVIVQPPEPPKSAETSTQENIPSSEETQKASPNEGVRQSDPWAPIAEPKFTVADQRPKSFDTRRQAEISQFQSFSASIDVHKLKPVSQSVSRNNSTTNSSSRVQFTSEHDIKASSMTMLSDANEVGRSIKRPSKSLSRSKARPLSSASPGEEPHNRLRRMKPRGESYSLRAPQILPQQWSHPKQLREVCSTEMRRFESVHPQPDLKDRFTKHPNSKLPDVVAFLIELGLNPNNRSQPDQYTALHHLIKDFSSWKCSLKLQDIERLIKILLDAGVDINSVAAPPVFDKSGRILSQTSPLYWAVHNNEEEAVAILLDQGADCQNDFHNLLVLAATREYWGVLEELTGKTKSKIRSKKRKVININSPLKGGVTMAGIALCEVQPKALEFLIDRYCYELSQELVFGSISAYMQNKLGYHKQGDLFLGRNVDVHGNLTAGVPFNNPFVVCIVEPSMVDKLPILIKHRYPLRKYLTEPVYSYVLQEAFRKGAAEVASLLLDARSFEVDNPGQLWTLALSADNSTRLKRVLIDHDIPGPKSSKYGALLGQFLGHK